MNIQEEKKEIVGLLLVQGQEFEMLDLYPQKHTDLPFWLKEHCFQFYVVVEGVATYIIVAREGFAIIPIFPPVTTTVKFFVEEDEEVNSQIQKRIDLLTNQTEQSLNSI